jgi:hypothetical protein
MVEAATLTKNKPDAPESRSHDHHDAAGTAKQNAQNEVMESRGTPGQRNVLEGRGQHPDKKQEASDGSLDLRTSPYDKSNSAGKSESNIDRSQASSGGRFEGDRQVALVIEPKAQKELFEKPGESDSVKQKEARDGLVNSIKQSDLSDRGKARCLTYMERFEKGARAQGMPEEYITNTYKALGESMDAKKASNGKDEPASSSAERALGLVDFLRSAANTDKIDQGRHNTCNVTQLRDREMETNPAQAAERFKSLTIDGQYLSHGANGERDRMIKLPPSSMRPDQEALAQQNGPIDGQRGYFGQLSDLALVNDFWQRRGLTYTQGEPGAYGREDTGERLVRSGTGRVMKDGRGRPITQPLLDSNAVKEIGQRMGFGDDFIYDNRDPHSTVGRLATKEKMAERLEKGSITMVVDSGHSIFTGTAGEGGAGGGHVVQISKSKLGKDYVHVDNSWGTGNDVDVPLAQFFDSTLSREDWQFNGRDDSARKTAWTNWRTSGGDRLDPNQVIRKDEFDAHQRSFEEQKKEPEKLTDKHKEDDAKDNEAHEKERLAQLDKDREVNETTEKQKSSELQQSQRVAALLKKEYLESRLAYASTNPEMSPALLSELRITLDGLLAKNLL